MTKKQKFFTELWAYIKPENKDQYESIPGWGTRMGHSTDIYCDRNKQSGTTTIKLKGKIGVFSQEDVETTQEWLKLKGFNNVQVDFHLNKDILDRNVLPVLRLKTQEPLW